MFRWRQRGVSKENFQVNQLGGGTGKKFGKKGGSVRDKNYKPQIRAQSLNPIKGT